MPNKMNVNTVIFMRTHCVRANRFALYCFWLHSQLKWCDEIQSDSPYLWSNEKQRALRGLTPSSMYNQMSLYRILFDSNTYIHLILIILHLILQCLSRWYAHTHILSNFLSFLCTRHWIWREKPPIMFSFILFVVS